ncbi:MAG: hypothetical protein IT422_16040, partial [Pirellulaceae bacterium]|nr:hypothetical protein [Pirellulaceae bacterium]
MKGSFGIEISRSQQSVGILRDRQIGSCPRLFSSITDTELDSYNKVQSLSYVRDNLGRATNINSTYDAWNIP